jgi:hypothetical protein
MFKLGNPPRSLRSFGVAGLLDAGSEVFYQTLFGSRHVGRVADLLVARLRTEGLDELRFRALVLFGLFRGEGTGLKYPVLLECGIDGEKLAIGFSYELPQGTRPTSAELHTQLTELRMNADGVVARFSAADRRLEIIGMLGIPGKLSTTRDTRVGNFEFVELEAPEATPRTLAYTQLGDLDYEKLLADEAAPRTASAVTTGGDRTTVHGVTQYLTDGDRTRVSGEATAGEESRVRELEARVAEFEASAQGRPPRGRPGFLKRLKYLFTARSDDSPEGLTLESLPLESPGAPAAGPEPLHSEYDVEKQVEQELDLRDALDLDSESGAGDLKELPHTLIESGGAMPEIDAAALLKEVEHGRFSQALTRASGEAIEIKGQIQSERAQRWVEGFMGEMLAERGRLQEMAKQVHSSVKQKELEFRNAEQRLMQELKLRDELLKQRGSALARAKEQLMQLATDTVPGRNEKNGFKTEDQKLMQKYNLSQKLLASAKKENIQSLLKIEDYRVQAVKARTLVADYGNMKTKLERALRQVEELKKSNQQLQERAGTGGDLKVKGPGSSQAIEEIKKKLDAAIRVAGKAEAQTEQLQLKLEEFQREEARLKKELFHARKEAAAASAAMLAEAAKKPVGSGTGGTGTAA